VLRLEVGRTRGAERVQQLAHLRRVGGERCPGGVALALHAEPELSLVRHDLDRGVAVDGDAPDRLIVGLLALRLCGGERGIAGVRYDGKSRERDEAREDDDRESSHAPCTPPRARPSHW
jgi:hypothetical protein